MLAFLTPEYSDLLMRERWTKWLIIHGKSHFKVVLTDNRAFYVKIHSKEVYYMVIPITLNASTELSEIYL